LSTLLSIAASVSTLVVSWNDAAETARTLERTQMPAEDECHAGTGEERDQHRQRPRNAEAIKRTVASAARIQDLLDAPHGGKVLVAVHQAQVVPLLNPRSRARR
jgi:hypothetical protein